MPLDGVVIKEGKTVKEAINKALRSLSISETQANIKILSEGRHGFLGLGARPARVKVSIKEEVVAELKLKDILIDLNLSDKPLGKHESPKVLDLARVNDDKQDSPSEVLEKKLGTAEIKNGSLIITNPVNETRYAAIKPDKNVKFTVNGETVSAETCVTAEDEIEIEMLEDEVVSSLDLRISNNKMKADLRLVSQFGARYRLRDQAPANKLVLQTELDGITEPPEVTLEQVKAFLEEKNVVKGIVEEAILNVIHHPNSKDTFTVATGLEPVDGVNGYIRYPFLESMDVSEEDSHFDRNKLISVSPGEVVAIKVPPQEGQDGWTVTGDVLAAKPPTDCDIFIKTGCEIVEDGQKVIATIFGRPVIETVTNKSVFYVDPIYVVKEVNLTTGNIKFAGDVEVKGDVRDGCTVEADGNIQVMGDVSRATLKAGASVVLNKMVLGSTIIAGGCAALYSSILPLLKQIRDLLKTIHVEAKQVKAKSGLNASDKQAVSDGMVVQLMIDSKYRSIPKAVEELLNTVHGSNVSVHEEVLNFVESLHKNLCGLGAVRIQSIDFLEELYRVLEEVIKMVKTLMRRADYTKVRYIQNCSLLSSGDVIVEGQGCYISSIRAGGDVIVCGKPGVARGVKIVAEGNIIVNDLGSDFETQTSVRTGDGGKVTAELIHPDVLIQIGKERFRVDKASRSFNAYLDYEGKLIVDRLLAEVKTQEKTDNARKERG
ncbi:MAG: flagellar assembly protein A [Eubacteriales bacterium]